MACLCNGPLEEQEIRNFGVFGILLLGGDGKERSCFFNECLMEITGSTITGMWFCYSFTAPECFTQTVALKPRWKAPFDGAGLLTSCTREMTSEGSLILRNLWNLPHGRHSQTMRPVSVRSGSPGEFLSTPHTHEEHRCLAGDCELKSSPPSWSIRKRLTQPLRDSALVT